MMKNGNFEQSFKTVEDPYDGGDLTVAVNVCHDAVEWLAHYRCCDAAQYKAGNYFMFLLERAAGAGTIICDPARVVVDNGRRIHELTESQQSAARKLRFLRDDIGNRDYQLAERVIGDGMVISRLPIPEREIRYLSRRFRQVLSDMAVHWGWQDRRQEVS